MNHQMEAVALFTDHSVRVFYAMTNSACFDQAIEAGALAVIQLQRLFYPISGEWVDVGSVPRNLRVGEGQWEMLPGPKARANARRRSNRAYQIYKKEIKK